MSDNAISTIAQGPSCSMPEEPLSSTPPAADELVCRAEDAPDAEGGDDCAGSAELVRRYTSGARGTGGTGAATPDDEQQNGPDCTFKMASTVGACGAAAAAAAGTAGIAAAFVGLSCVGAAGTLIDCLAEVSGRR